MTRLTVNIEPYLDNVVGNALRLNKQALALTIPNILADMLGLHLFYGDDKQTLLSDKTYIYKVVCGKSCWDISPAFTKGCKRTKLKQSPKEYLASKGIDGVLFVDFRECDGVVLKFTLLSKLKDNTDGEYSRGDIFE